MSVGDGLYETLCSAKEIVTTSLGGTSLTESEPVPRIARKASRRGFLGGDQKAAQSGD